MYLVCSTEHIDAFFHLGIVLQILSCWAWKSSFAAIPEEQSLLPHYCGIGDLATAAAANCYLLVIQSHFIYFYPCHAGPMSVIIIGVHLTIVNYVVFYDILHSCHAVGEFEWERHIWTTKIESHSKLHCVTRFLMS
jgi:hypothetical protein